MPTSAMLHSGSSGVIGDGPFAGILAIYQTADARLDLALEIFSMPRIDAGRCLAAGQC